MRAQPLPPQDDAQGHSVCLYEQHLKLKTDEAKRLIRKKISFSEIAERLGFDSLSHFNYIFKHYAGMTPGEYKKSIRRPDLPAK